MRMHRDLSDRNEWTEARIVAAIFRGASVREYRGLSDAFSDAEILEIANRADLPDYLRDQAFYYLLG